MSDLLRLDRVTQRFGETTVLADVDLTLARGERLAIVGASGSGKTTLLRLIAGLAAPTAGEVTIDGVAASRAGRVVVPPERRDVAVVFQGLALFPHLRALDQIAFAARGRGGLPHARELLARIGLAHRASASLDELSGGERQRVALARALAQRPALLLMDEPFASLDDPTRAEMRALLRSLLDASGATLVLVTHSRDDALDVAQRVVVLDRGRVVAAGTMEDVMRRPRHVAAVRCLGLGQIVDGVVAADGAVVTPFGRVRVDARIDAPSARVLIRSAQPRVVADGVVAVVVAIELRPPVDGDRVRRIAVVRAGEDQTLRVEHADARVGDHVRVRIEGACIVLAG